MEAIECVSPGIEVHNYKFWFGKPTLQELVASNGIHAGLVIGTEKVRPVGLDLQPGGCWPLQERRIGGLWDRRRNHGRAA